MKPELLAPAGSIESFHAAVEAGADAVYLGLGEFNARLRAKNFSVRDLSALLPYAHSRGVRIYVALNTLIKQGEIKSALNIMYQLDQLGADAIIVADIGLMKLAALYFPGLRIHASTQAAIHNSYGAAVMKELGASRVVLARELSIDEIGATARNSPIETEVFVHGALCYSISGMCLASSFLGGSSGNRGQCTQVCRRRFKCAGGDGYLFSPHDLQAVTAVGKLADAGVACFKIEGRMKGAEYVHTVVKAYRTAIDHPGGAGQAAEDLRFDFGREKTMFFLDGCEGSPIDPARPSGTGIPAGTITKLLRGERQGDTAFELSTDKEIGSGDRLRIQPRSGFEGAACRVASCEPLGNGATAVRLTSPIACGAGDYVFIVCKAENMQTRNDAVPAAPPANITMYCPDAPKIADSLTPPAAVAAPPKPKLWFRADTVGWFDVMSASPCRRLIFDADIGELELLLDSPEVLRTWRSRTFVALPPFIPEGEIGFWRGVVEKCLSAGLQSFAVSNAGHFPLVRGAGEILADAPLSCINRFTQRELAALGAEKFVYSFEDDSPNLRNSASGAGVAPVYGCPPLFVSRMPPAAECGAPVTDPHGNKFAVRRKNGLYYTFSATPMCLFSKRGKISSCGIENFLIDVCFRAPDQAAVNKLVADFKYGVRTEKCSMFNFKAGMH